MCLLHVHNSTRVAFGDGEMVVGGGWYFQVSSNRSHKLATMKFWQSLKRESQILVPCSTRYLNLTLTIALTLLTLLLSTVFNMVQEFGTAVLRTAEILAP